MVEVGVILVYISAIAFIASLIGFWIWMLVDLGKRKFKKGGKKGLWFVIVLLLGALGAALYLFFIKIKSQESKETLGYALGAFSILFSLLSPLLGALSSLIGGSLCITSMKKSKKRKLGLSINIVGLVMNILMFIGYILSYSTISSSGGIL